VKAALYNLKDNTSGGLAAPITVTPGHPVFVPCYFGATIKDGALQALNGGQPTCLNAQQTAKLASALKALA
jgi:hypothetical protein